MSSKKNRGDKSYKALLKELQIELVKIQRHAIAHNHRILVIFEGRDASGKDGAIKRVVEHLSPRETRVVALGKPSDHDRRSWYFQRYAQHLPADQEIVLFNRSWYNRAGVERVMGFCTESEYRSFIGDVGPFEKLLASGGAQILKYYLDIDRNEQTRRLKDRRTDPLKQWKVSPIDEAAIENWDAYSSARDEMLLATDFDFAPWHAVQANDKKEARLNVIRHMLSAIDCPDKALHLARPDPDIVFRIDDAAIGRLAR